MRAKEFEIKKRDPNWKAMQDIRRSGAGGQHKDKKKAAKQGQVKHKGRMAEGADELYGIRIGDTVTTEFNGREVQGDVIDLFPDDMQVELLLRGPESGRTIVVDVRDTEFFEDTNSDEPDEEYLDKVISDLHKDALGFRPDQEFGREWMSSSFEKKLEIYNNLLKSLHSDMDEGIGGTIAGGVGQFIGNKIDPLHGEIMRAHGEMAGRKAEYTIRKYMHLLQKALKQQLDSGGKGNESMREASDFGEPREILEDVLQTLEREVEWPLTDVMDPKEVKQLLAPLVKAVNDKMMSMEEGRRDYGYDSFGNSLRPGDDEGSSEPPNNFAIYINGKKWKVFQGKGQYADDEYEMKQFRQLQAMAARKSQETGKKWEVSRTGEPATK